MTPLTEPEIARNLIIRTLSVFTPEEQERILNEVRSGLKGVKVFVPLSEQIGKQAEPLQFVK